MAKKFKHRIQLDFTEKAFQELEELKTDGVFPNRAECIRGALKWLRWSLDQTKSGATFIVEKDKKQLEIVFPWPEKTPVKSN